MDTGCTPCIERLPSCVELPNGRHGFPGQLWSSKFILCHLNRTIDIGDCPDGQKFDPHGRFCITPTVNVGMFDLICLLQAEYFVLEGFSFQFSCFKECMLYAAYCMRLCLILL